MFDDLDDAPQSQQGGLLNHRNTALEQLYHPVDGNVVAAFDALKVEAVEDIGESC